MQPRVTAVLVARNGAQYLPRTLEALAAQVRRPDRVIFVDMSSTDSTARLLTSAPVVTAPNRRSLGAAVAFGLHAAAPVAVDNEWLWILGHDNAAHPGALSALLGAVEVAPSVAIAGPKLMRWDDPAVIANFGETLTRFGRSLAVVSEELDQAQHDIQSDILGVEAGGMLVRREVWTALGGFDPALPSVDAGLDFSVRARLAGHRVIGVPAARVATAGPPELFGRRSVSAGAQNRIRRSAQLHRRLVYSPPLALPLHWLTLVPLAILRSLVHLLAKRPGSVGGELAAGISAAFDGSVIGARRRLRRARVLGWAAVDALRMPLAEVRERRAHERSSTSVGAVERTGPGFFAGGGAWVVLFAAVAGVVAFGRFVDASALAGGALVPLSASVGELWSHVGVAWRDIGPGFLAAADPFGYLLATLGTLTFWSPSLSIVALYLVAIPLSALTAWVCAARFSVRPWAPVVAALAWAAAPPLLSSLAGGHLGAVVAHILLPTLVVALVGAARSWATAAVAALVFAAIAASTPILVPALLVLLVAWIVARPTSVHRLIGIPIPAVALVAPLVAQQLARGNWLGLVADPGLAVVNSPPSGWQLALGAPMAGLHGWESFMAGFGVAPAVAPLVVMMLLAPLAALALLALFLPGSRRSIPAMLIALLGFVTAVVGTHISVSLVGSQATPVWPGAALSLYWLGLVAAMAVALDALGKSAALPAFMAGVGVVAVALPLVTSAASGAIAVTESTGRLLPAFVSAEAANDPTLGTLELTAQPNGAIAVTVHRGLGTTLDEHSTLASTDTLLSEADARLATLAGNISSRSGFDVAAELDALHIAFLLVPDASAANALAHDRIVEALDGNRILTPIGETAYGFLWHYELLGEGEAPTGPGATDTALGVAILVGQGLVFGMTILLAIPTTRRKRVRAARVTPATSEEGGAK